MKHSFVRCNAGFTRCFAPVHVLYIKLYEMSWHLPARRVSVCVRARALKEQPQTHAHTATLPTRRVQRDVCGSAFPLSASSSDRRSVQISAHQRNWKQTKIVYRTHWLRVCVCVLSACESHPGPIFFWQIFNETQHDSFNCQHIPQLIYTISRNPRL